MPFFSVVIPCYNSSAYLRETLLALKNQSFKDFEVVLVDDNSTDDSFELAKSLFNEFGLIGKCVQKDISQYPKGVSGARNMGIDLSSGTWICFLDSDDLFEKEKLAGCFDIISQNQQIKALHHAVVEFDDETGKELNKVVLNELKGIHEKLPKLLSFNNICTSTVCFHRSLLQEIGNFNTNLNGIEDFYMWLLASKKTHWYYSVSCWTRYRVRAESLMGNKPLKHYFKQNMGLLAIVKNHPQFSKDEFRRLEKYLAKEVIAYYANNSVNRVGVFKTILELAGIIKYRYLGVFWTNALRLTKNYVLSKVVKLAK
ncbi:MAG: glycosyltransferase [Cytophagales bacterium]